MYCPNCGTNNAATARFCLKCGAPLAVTPQPATPGQNSRPSFWQERTVQIVMVLALAVVVVVALIVVSQSMTGSGSGNINSDPNIGNIFSNIYVSV
jgi:uncharacterized membrane protein YvbJ